MTVHRYIDDKHTTKKIPSGKNRRNHVGNSRRSHLFSLFFVFNFQIWKFRKPRARSNNTNANHKFTNSRGQGKGYLFVFKTDWKEWYGIKFSLAWATHAATQDRTRNILEGNIEWPIAGVTDEVPKPPVARWSLAEVRDILEGGGDISVTERSCLKL